MDLAVTIERLREYVRHGSVSADPGAGEGMLGARHFVSGLLRNLGFAVEEVTTPLHPVLLARLHHDREGSENWPHVVFYGHYDVQPPEPLDLWESPPFEAEVRGNRIYGRGASDNKGPQMVVIAALERLLTRYPDLPLRFTFLIEGEEEIGSPSFGSVLDRYGEEISQAGFFLISDTGGPSEEQVVVTTGLRGLVDLEVKVSGPGGDLHSGLHGGAILNPIQALVRICASLHRPDGGIDIEGFYDGVREAEDWERAELAKSPLDENAYREYLGVPDFFPHPGFSPSEAIRFAPTLEFNGIGGGYQGTGGKTVIPASAFCKITCRLVPDQDPDRIMQKLVAAIRERCPSQVQVEIREGARAFPYRVAPPGRPDTPAHQSPVLQKGFEAVDAAVEESFGGKPLYLPQGGSIPIIADIRKRTGLDSILLGLYTNADNAHAPNESFHLGMMEKGILAYEGALLRLASLR